LYQINKIKKFIIENLSVCANFQAAEAGNPIIAIYSKKEVEFEEAIEFLNLVRKK